MNIPKISDTTLEDSDTTESYRVIKCDKNMRSKKIVVKLKTKEKRDECYFNRKKLAGIDFKEIGIEAERTYMNENPRPSTRKLLPEANKPRKSLNHETVWTQRGTKKNSNSAILTPQEDNDLKSITQSRTKCNLLSSLL